MSVSTWCIQTVWAGEWWKHQPFGNISISPTDIKQSIWERTILKIYSARFFLLLFSAFLVCGVGRSYLVLVSIAKWAVPYLSSPSCMDTKRTKQGLVGGARNSEDHPDWSESKKQSIIYYMLFCSVCVWGGVQTKLNLKSLFLSQVPGSRQVLSQVPGKFQSHYHGTQIKTTCIVWTL